MSKTTGRDLTITYNNNEQTSQFTYKQISLVPMPEEGKAKALPMCKL